MTLSVNHGAGNCLLWAWQRGLFPPLGKPVSLQAVSLAEILQALLPALQSPVGAVAFVPLYALWVTLLLPGVWASMLAGALYGPWWGTLIVFVGACLGAQAAFLLGRTWLRAWAQRRLAGLPKLQRWNGR